jgi:hypothetical protein
MFTSFHIQQKKYITRFCPGSSNNIIIIKTPKPPIKKTALVSYILAVLPHVFTQQVPSCHVQAAPSVQLAGVGRQSGLHFATTQLSDKYG